MNNTHYSDIKYEPCIIREFTDKIMFHNKLGSFTFIKNKQNIQGLYFF